MFGPFRGILALITVCTISFFSAKGIIKFFSLFIPGLPTEEEMFGNLDEEIILAELSKYQRYISASYDLLFLATSYFEALTKYIIDYKNNPNVYRDTYRYFRYEFLTTNRIFLKFTIVAIIVFPPLAIWESYEYGFPKEFLYAIPIVFYTCLGFYFLTINFAAVYSYVESSWFFNADFYVPSAGSWEEYVYSRARREAYLLKKIKIFYKYMSTESIDTRREIWEEPVYESKHRSIVRRFYTNYIRPRLKMPKLPSWFYRENRKKFVFKEGERKKW